jgi:catechol 2,3-dioxygenase-like lactoylglutathione lyase family enzyme
MFVCYATPYYLRQGAPPIKFVLPLIAVRDIRVARAFYERVLGQRVALDLGANLSFDAGFALQEDYAGLVGTGDLTVMYGSNHHELYFEEDDFDGFIARLDAMEGIDYLHRAKEYPWGQRVVRFYDPDGHIIEVGESMETVFKRFQSQGMSVEEVAERTMHPVDFVRRYIG